jgi:hypothetical protein
VLIGKLEVMTSLWLFEFAVVDIRKVVNEGFAGKENMTIDVRIVHENTCN